MPTQRYREEHLHASEHPIGGDARHTLLHELCSAESAEQRKRIVRGQLAELGFAHMEFMLLADGAEEPVLEGYFTSYVDAAWADRYLMANYFNADPRLHPLPPSFLPIRWHCDALQASNSAGEALLADLRAAGMTSGLCFAIDPVPPARSRAVFLFSAPEASDDWMTDAVMGRASVLGLSVHEFFSHNRRLRQPANTEEPLTVRQLQILRFLAEGKRDKEIADILSLSKHTIDYHLRMLKRRFTARTRTQLVTATSRLVADTADGRSFQLIR